MLVVKLRDGEVIEYASDEWYAVDVHDGFVIIQNKIFSRTYNVAIFAADTVEKVTTDE